MLRSACIEFKCDCGPYSKLSFESTWREDFPKLADLANENSEVVSTVRLYELVHEKKEEKKINKKVPDMISYLFGKIDQAVGHNNQSHSTILMVRFNFNFNQFGHGGGTNIPPIFRIALVKFRILFFLKFH